MALAGPGVFRALSCAALNPAACLSLRLSALLCSAHVQALLALVLLGINLCNCCHPSSIVYSHPHPTLRSHPQVAHILAISISVRFSPSVISAAPGLRTQPWPSGLSFTLVHAPPAHLPVHPLWWEPSLTPPQPLYRGRKTIFIVKLLYLGRSIYLLVQQLLQLVANLCLHVRM